MNARLKNLLEQEEADLNFNNEESVNCGMMLGYRWYIGTKSIR